MVKIILLLHFLSIFSFVEIKSNAKPDYDLYHQQVIEAERLIVSENYAKALLVYEQLFSAYEFVFVREYQIAAQLALHANDKEKANKYIKQGILSGWEMKSIKKNTFLTELRKGEKWKLVEKEYPNLRKQYESNINQDLREQVKTMYSKDQKKALKALFRFGSKAQDTYAETKFAPHSEKQMVEFSAILKTYGYATIDDWYRAIIYDRNKPGYGILDPPLPSSLSTTNELRKKIYARPFELRDDLEAIQQKTGMNFYLSDRWY